MQASCFLSLSLCVAVHVASIDDNSEDIMSAGSSRGRCFSRTMTCLAPRVMGSAVKIHFAAPTMLAAPLPFSSPYTSMTTLRTSSLQVRKKVTIRTPQNCFMHLTRIHTCQIQITQLHMTCHVKVRQQLRHHQRNVVSG